MRLFRESRNSLGCCLLFMRSIVTSLTVTFMHLALMLMKIERADSFSSHFERFNIACLIFHR